MGYSRRIGIAVGSVRVYASDRGDGDFQIVAPAADVEQRRTNIVDAPWTWVHQVHGTTVLEVSEPGQHAGTEADGLITTAAWCPIAVTTADCMPVVLAAETGVAVVHAGWRGLEGGIIESTAARLQALAGDPVDAIIGPCIHPENYEFGRDDLERLADHYGRAVVGTTHDGKPALDMPAALTEACRRAGWQVSEIGPCTSGFDYFSHRTRAEVERQTTVVWIEPMADSPR